MSRIAFDINAAGIVPEGRLPAADVGLARRASAQLCCLLHTFPGCGIQYEPIPLAWRVRRSTPEFLPAVPVFADGS